MIIEINNEILEKNVYEYLIVTLFIPLSLFTVTKGPPCFSTVAFFELTVTVNPLYRNTGKTGSIIYGTDESELILQPHFYFRY
ncbi:hypothetical protein BVA20_01358 [Enterococcus faecium]|nr:hypothetical protein BVA20_01358 [Enterococcus faecium]